VTFAALITAERHTIEPGEAALTAAGHSRDRDDCLLLLEALGLGPEVRYRWTVQRVALLAVTRCRQGAGFSANTLRRLMPQRAWHLLPAAFAAMVRAGLAEPTGERVRSDSPGSNRRRTAVYRLTSAGERLSLDIEPPPGMGLLISRIV
jgi:hypothetical protein